MINYEYHDGGRYKAGYKRQNVKDCVVRAIAIATRRDYEEVYQTAKRIIGYSPRNGVRLHDTDTLMAHFGGTWVHTSDSVFKAHLRASDLPICGPIIVRMPRHVAAVVNGTLYDSWDCSKGGATGIYGYWVF